MQGQVIITALNSDLNKTNYQSYTTTYLKSHKKEINKRLTNRSTPMLITLRFIRTGELSCCHHKENAVEKMDLKKMLRHLYQPSAREIVRVDVPAMNFLMVDGMGDPNTSQAFSDAVEVLFSLSYTLKFMTRNGWLAIDYGVLPLEALWWADDMSVFSTGDKDAWKWTVMIMQPEFITLSMVDEATEAVRRKKNQVSLPLVRFEAFEEGKAAQVLHIGPFSEEGPTIEKVHKFIESCGCKRAGKHHEIYLSDIRRAAPAKWKTVIRQPMQE
jgi:hypothetical protein